MTDGSFEYRVRVLRGEEELAAATRQFFVVAEATTGSSGS